MRGIRRPSPQSSGQATLGPRASPVALAAGLAAGGRVKEAEQVLAEAWSRAPTVHVACALAGLRRRSEGPEAALRLVSQARSLFPAAVRLMEEEARWRQSVRDWAGAAQAWACVLERRPGDPRARAAHLAACVRALPPDLAIAELRSLLRLPRLSGEMSLHRLLARLLEGQDRPREALEAWQAASVLAPGDPRTRAALVFALRRCGGRAAAFPRLLALVAAQPRLTPALSALVADAKALGRVAQARRLLVDLVRCEPGLRHLWGWIRRLGPAGAATRSGPEGR